MIKLKHGMRVRGKIEGVECIGKISENEGSGYTWYFCQNKKDKRDIKAKTNFGFEYCWGFHKQDEESVTDLKTISSDIENLYEGCVIENSRGRKEVLGICGRVVFISMSNDFNKGHTFAWTIEELKSSGYKMVLDEPEEEVEELTMEELCSELGRTVKIIKEDK